MEIKQEENRRKKRFRRDPEKEQLWRQRLDEQKKSNLKIVDYCRRTGLSAASFHWWKNEIRKRDDENNKHVDNLFQKANETCQVKENTKDTLSPKPGLTKNTLSAPKPCLETPKQENRHADPAVRPTEKNHAPAFAEISLTSTTTNKERPLEDHIAGNSSKSHGIEIVLNTGRLIRIRNRSDIDLLIAVTDALEGKTTPC
jgi:hypothetical protein